MPFIQVLLLATWFKPQELINKKFYALVASVLRTLLLTRVKLKIQIKT